MNIFVSVGTDHHPFDRLVGWASEWAEHHPEDEVFVQYGTSSTPTAGDGTDLLDRTSMLARVAAADVVVVSCGPGGVMDVRAAGRLPIVVARREPLGEHVDDHQLAFARHLETNGLARTIEDGPGFTAVVDEARRHPDRFRVEFVDDQPSGIAEFGRLADRLVWGT